MVKVYRIADDGRRIAAGAFLANSESDLQSKWELHLATAPVASTSPHIEVFSLVSALPRMR